MAPLMAALTLGTELYHEGYSIQDTRLELSLISSLQTDLSIVEDEDHLTQGAKHPKTLGRAVRTDLPQKDDICYPDTLAGSFTCDERSFKIVPIPGKGLGFIARVDIPAGTVILAERPSILLNNSDTPPAEQLSKLEEEHQKHIMSLSNARPDHHTLENIIFTNAIPFRRLHPQGGLFVNASRINHACNPNTMHIWNETAGVLVKYALRSIKEGEEITSSYIDDFAEFQERRAYFVKHLNFTCDCDQCNLPVKEKDASNERIQKLKRLRRMLLYLSNDFEVVPTLKYIHEFLDLAHEEKFLGELIRDAYALAEKVARTNGLLGRATIFATRGHAVESLWNWKQSNFETGNGTLVRQYQERVRSGDWRLAQDELFEDWLFEEDRWSLEMHMYPSIHVIHQQEKEAADTWPEVPPDERQIDEESSI